MIFWFLLPILAFSLPPDAYRNITEMVTAHGYIHELHKVTTEDGYILLMIRVNSPEPYSGKKIPLLYVPGLISGPENAFSAGRPYSIPFFLADKNYDVWVPCTRGTTYGKNHIKYKTNEYAFWNFTFDEIGIYDYDAFIKHIIQNTGFQRIHFVGHSQAGTQLIVALTLAPEKYSKNLASIVMIGPPTYFDPPSIALRLMYWTNLPDILMNLGIYEFMPYTKWMAFASAYIMDIWPSLGSKILELMCDYYPEGLNMTNAATFMAHYPQGGSTKNMKHLIMNMGKPGFYKYREKASDPLIPYDFSKIPNGLNMFILQGAGDMMASTDSVVWLHKELLKYRIKHTVKLYPWVGHLGVIAPNNCCTQHLEDIYAFIKSCEANL